MHLRRIRREPHRNLIQVCGCMRPARKRDGNAGLKRYREGFQGDHLVGKGTIDCIGPPPTEKLFSPPIITKSPILSFTFVAYKLISRMPLSVPKMVIASLNAAV